MTTFDLAAIEARWHDGGASLADIEPLIEEVKRLQDKVKTAYDQLKAGLEREQDLRHNLALVRSGVDYVWYWQGRDGRDDGNYPASLSCPVVMEASTCRAMLAHAERAQKSEAEAAKARMERDEVAAEADRAWALVDALKRHARDPDDATADAIDWLESGGDVAVSARTWPESHERLARALTRKGVPAYFGQDWDGAHDNSAGWYFNPRGNGVGVHVRYDGGKYEDVYLEPKLLVAVEAALDALPNEPSREVIWAAIEAVQRSKA